VSREPFSVFADYRQDFSLLDIIKQIFPEIIAPNRGAHLQSSAMRWFSFRICEKLDWAETGFLQSCWPYE
jgi:hypothetical protein